MVTSRRPAVAGLWPARKVKKEERSLTNEEAYLHWIDLSVTGICRHNDYSPGMEDVVPQLRDSVATSRCSSQ